MGCKFASFQAVSWWHFFGALERSDYTGVSLLSIVKNVHKCITSQGKGCIVWNVLLLRQELFTSCSKLSHHATQGHSCNKSMQLFIGAYEVPRPQMSFIRLFQVEAPWVKMALYCDDIYIIPGQVTWLDRGCDHRWIILTVFIVKIWILLSTMSQWVGRGNITIGWWGYKDVDEVVGSIINVKCARLRYLLTTRRESGLELLLFSQSELKPHEFSMLKY